MSFILPSSGALAGCPDAQRGPLVSRHSSPGRPAELAF